MAQIQLTLIAILLAGGGVYLYSKAAIIAFRINSQCLRIKRLERENLKHLFEMITYLTIYVTLGGICFASVLYLTLGGDALSLIGCITPLSFILGPMYGLGTIWRSRLAIKLTKK